METAQPGSVEDLTTLAKLDERILLEELQERYRQNKIYTYVGDILVAVNPYRDVGIYGSDESRRYRNARKSSHPPHVFAVADMAYQAMLGHGGIRPCNQCVLISGESGAGKTESTKLIIKQVVDLCRGNSQLEQQILQVNPLLEAFGNAQTVMNDNSSRFGKYIQLKFDSGHLMGAKISEYLLEKSRVVRQNCGEENFHIFYYLFSVQNSALISRLCLTDPSSYRYLSNGGQRVARDRRLLQKHYDDLLNSMDLVGFTDEEQADVFSAIAGVLHLGNVDFGADDNDAAFVADMNSAIKSATGLLGVSADDVAACLTSSCWVQHGEYIKRHYTQAMAEDSRDAMAKAIYGRLFGWIVNMVNSLLRPAQHINPGQEHEIGILDIFGFEHFETNSFEQACINLANEQLQFFFNQHIFKMEQEEYTREGIDWKEIKFVDNKPLLDLFLARPIGLLALLDEESLFPKGTDESFVQKVTTHFHKHGSFIRSPQSKTVSFSISHYAGKVTYDASGWLEKNRDTLPTGITEILQTSSNPLIRTIFKASISRTGTLSLQGRRTMRSKMSKKRPTSTPGSTAGKNKVTVGGQFKKSLMILMEKMTASSPIFVRCLKPNHQKQPGVFDQDYIQAQLLYTGMLETVKIRREGFAFRPSFDDFVQKYKLLLGRARLKGDMENCLKILKAASIHGYCMGKTKVFLRLPHMERLTEALDKVAKAVVQVQKVVRGFLARRHVQLRRLEAKRQAQLTELLMRQAMDAGDATLARQHALLEHDSKKPKGKQAASAAPPVPAFPTPLYQSVIPGTPAPAQPGNQGYLTPQPRFATTGTQMDEGEESDEILEDSFEPPVAIATQTSPKEWFSKTTQVDQVYDESQNKFQEWFHGVISRRESELLLKDKAVGCFLIRVSESRFGYTLSFRAKERVRHYMISQLKNHKFVIIGENRVHRTLNALVDFYKKNKLSNWNGFLTVSCGQREGECDYIDLIPESRLYHVLEEQGRGTRRYTRGPPGTSVYTAAYTPVPGGQHRAAANYDVPPDRRSKPPAPLPAASRPPAMLPGQRPESSGRPLSNPPEGEYQMSQGLYQVPPGVSGRPLSQPPEGVYNDPYTPVQDGAPPIPSRTYDIPRDLRQPGHVMNDTTRSKMAGRPLPSVPGPGAASPAPGSGDPLVPPRGEVYQRLLQNQQNQHNGSPQQKQQARLSGMRGQLK